ncbi:endonuclease/exonuclease/phosphatase family protein [Streptomyces sp. WMMC500]|uniref:endonuclease/exonuclease/phosphatase family protein n=1 Tax=Streptomyces sp. WMMC500 TaxID=3015154 RepID=UPI00248C3F54|nr:endonuclease/exonuclease/phosphatase family protein [Streptomyces sp. WMMC500]WBB62196.1 endonuclease/exonuclease/phosphatase family protein [Streptomyces sp. WMMC500]
MLDGQPENAGGGKAAGAPRADTGAGAAPADAEIAKRTAGTARGGASARHRSRLRRACALAGGLPLLVVSAVLGFRAGGGDGVTPLPQLAAFLPWLLVPGGAGLLFMALARSRAGVVWAVVALAATAWFVRPYESAADPPSSPPRAEFRLLTANLRFGDATPALRAALRAYEPDIALVQECDSRCVAALRSPALRAAYPYRVVDAGDPAEGSAVLSRYPLTEEPGVRGTLSMPAAVARVAGERVRLQVVHPMPPTPGSMDAWRTELGRLRDAAAARGDAPTVFGGDFNASQDHEAFRDILDTGLRDSAMLLGRSRTPTWPASTTPLFGTQIDHVLVSDRLSPAAIEFPELAGTDHRAVLVDLQLR